MFPFNADLWLVNRNRSCDVLFDLVQIQTLRFRGKGLDQRITLNSQLTTTHHHHKQFTSSMIHWKSVQNISISKERFKDENLKISKSKPLFLVLKSKLKPNIEVPTLVTFIVHLNVWLYSWLMVDPWALKTKERLVKRNKTTENFDRLPISLLVLLSSLHLVAAIK